MNRKFAANFLAVTAIATGAANLPANAAITAQLSAGPACGGAAAANFTTGGPPIKVSVCVSTTSEQLCGVSYTLRAASAGESNRFVVTARLLGASYNDATSFTLPPIANPAVGDLGSGPDPLAPVAAGANQLLATLDITPQANATNSAYIISLDPNAIVSQDQDGACGGHPTVPVDPVEVAIAATFTLNQASSPQITSENTATFTVNSVASFTVAATGTPAPTLSMTGAPPTGVTFTPATGVLAGTPQLGTVGNHPLTFTAANGNAPDFMQSFTLMVQKANQAINFGPLADRAYSATPFAVSATSTSLLAVAFSTTTVSVCSLSGTNVTMLTAGTCTVDAIQLGDANFNPAANVSQSFLISGTHSVTPSAGTNGSISPNLPVAVGHGLTTTFTVTANAGYTASVGGSCGGMLSGTTYTTNAIVMDCTVSATFTPSLSLVAVESRKTHGATGECNVTIDRSVPMMGSVDVEPRNVGTGHMIVFRFDGTVSSVGSVTAVDATAASVFSSASQVGNELLVTLTGVSDNSRVTVTLTGVNGALNTSASLGFLAGDVTNSRSVNAADISAVKARAAQTLPSSQHCKFDTDVDGIINSRDVNVAKARAGLVLQ